MIELLPNLYAVKVPADAHNFRIEFAENEKGINYRLLFNIIKDEYSYFSCYVDSNFTILGIVTKYIIDFDVEPYVEKRKIGYTDYLGDEWWLLCEKQSFRSLLTSKGIHFVNPLGNRNEYLVSASEPGDYSYLSRKWQQAEENLTHKLIILKKL